MNKILLIGKKGQVGWELSRTCCTLGELISLDYPEIDLAQSDSIRNIIDSTKPNIIINAAAYTNVDKAESEPELARAINGIAPGILAEEAKKLGAVLIHYSTDYVFDGTKGSPYVETDTPNPLNIYGSTKLEGEQIVRSVGGAYIIFRTSWVYSLSKGGFVTKVLQWARQQKTLQIVDDQIGSPTWARMLAEVTSQVIAQGRDNTQEYISEKSGLYHLAGGGSCSRYEWAKAILESDPNKKEQVVKDLLTAKTSDFPAPAARPNNTVLVCNHFYNHFKLILPDWRISIRAMLE